VLFCRWVASISWRKVLLLQLLLLFELRDGLGVFRNSFLFKLCILCIRSVLILFVIIIFSLYEIISLIRLGSRCDWRDLEQSKLFLTVTFPTKILHFKRILLQLVRLSVVYSAWCRLQLFLMSLLFFSYVLGTLHCQKRVLLSAQSN